MENIEIKARINNYNSTYEKLLSVGAQRINTLTQHDIYLPVLIGRLKIRLEEENHPQLIYYLRSNKKEARSSRYFIFPFSSKIPLLSILQKLVLLKRGEVIKSRELFQLNNIRIHLDRVNNLGNYIEFEAVQSNQTDKMADKRKIAQLLDCLDLDISSFCSSSYLELSKGGSQNVYRTQTL